MKFVSFKSNGLGIFINPNAVSAIAYSVQEGSSTLFSLTGVPLEVEGTPAEVREKLEGKDPCVF
jgi:hypothetical protein